MALEGHRIAVPAVTATATVVRPPPRVILGEVMRGGKKAISSGETGER